MSPIIREARLDDVGAMLRIEDAVFPGDRLSRRNFRHAVASASIIALVASVASVIVGYVLVETRRGTRVGRLSSIAVAPEMAGSGVGGMLARAAEIAALARGCDRLRLEVRADNARAIALYERSGYREIARRPRYYEDDEAALKLEKALG